MAVAGNDEASTRARYQSIVEGLRTYAQTEGRLSEAVLGPERQVFVKGSIVMKYLLEEERFGLNMVKDSKQAEKLFSEILQFGIQTSEKKPVLMMRVDPLMEPILGDDLKPRRTADGRPMMRKRRVRYPDGPILVKHHMNEQGRPLKSTFELAWNPGATEGRYIFVLKESAFWANARLGLILFGVLAVTTIRIWPMWIKNVLWYIAVTFLLIFAAVVVIQWIVYMVLLPFGIEAIIWPQLWDDVDPITAFTPTPSIRVVAGYWYLRAATIAFWAMIFWWIRVHAAELEEMTEHPTAFIEDLYAGNLMPESSGDPFAQQKHIPSIEDIERALREEEEQEHVGPHSNAQEAPIYDDDEGSGDGGDGGDEGNTGEGSAEDAAAEALRRAEEEERADREADERAAAAEAAAAAAAGGDL